MNMFKLVTTNDDTFSSLYRDVQDSDVVYLDVEANSLDPYTGTLILVQIKANDNLYLVDCTKLDNKHLVRLVKLLKSVNSLAVGHNIKFDIKYLQTKTGVLLENIYDTMTAESIITGGDNLYSSYKELSLKYCNEKIEKDARDLFINFNGTVTQEMLLYGAIDIIHLEKIRDSQLVLINETKQNKVLDLENKLLPVVANMELVGIGLDTEKWNIILKENEELRDQMLLDIVNTIWDKFIELDINYENALEMCKFFSITDITKTKKNQAFLESLKESGFVKEVFINNFKITSYTQVLEALKMYGINVTSTGEKVLNAYIKDNDLSEEQLNFINSILEYRKQNKKVTSYGEEFAKKANPITNRIHADFMQIGTKTGRFSCSSPNLQNIPREEKYRKCFIPRPGYKMITVDYSQQEYRLAGWVSGEPTIIDSYKKGIDIHTSTACLVYHTSPDLVTKEQRQNAKNINFALIYGSSDYGLAYNMNLTIGETRKLISAYYSERKRLAYFKEVAEETIWNKLYSVTPLGRRRNFEQRDFFSSGREAEWYEAMVKREGFNHIVQGGSGDMIKLAMVYTYYKNPFGELLNTVLQVHDEIVVEVHESILEKAEQFIVSCMIDAGSEFLGEIPVEVSVSEEKDSWSK